MTAEAITIANALRLAAGCVRDAAILAETGSRNAAYLAELAFEQVLRAIASSESIHIARADAHLLDKFVRTLPGDHPEKLAMERLVWLEAYATTFRYTTPTGRIPISPDQAKLNDAIVEMRLLVDRLARHFAVDLSDTSAKAQNAVPMRSG